MDNGSAETNGRDNDSSSPTERRERPQRWDEMDEDSELQQEGETLAEVIAALGPLVDRPAVARLLNACAVRIESHESVKVKEFELRESIAHANGRYFSSNRAYFLVGLAVCLVFLGIVMWMFRTDRETLLPVLTAIIGLIAGAGGGFIFGQQGRSEVQRS